MLLPLLLWIGVGPCSLENSIKRQYDYANLTSCCSDWIANACMFTLLFFLLFFSTGPGQLYSLTYLRIPSFYYIGRRLTCCSGDGPRQRELLSAGRRQRLQRVRRRLLPLRRIRGGLRAGDAHVCRGRQRHAGAGRHAGQAGLHERPDGAEELGRAAGRRAHDGA